MPASPVKDIPYRLAPPFDERFSDQAFIDSLNDAEGLKGARRYVPTPAALSALSTLASASDDRLRSFLFHPDERVVLALLKDSRLLPRRSEAQVSDRVASILAAAFGRATSSAASEGVYWNPVLEVLASRYHWVMSASTSSHRQGVDDDYPFPQAYRADPHVQRTSPMSPASAPLPPVDIPHLREFLRPLAEWAASAHSGQTLGLMECDVSPIRSIVASRTPGLTSVEMRRILRHGEKWTSLWLSQNKTLSPSLTLRPLRFEMALVIRSHIQRPRFPGDGDKATRVHRRIIAASHAVGELAPLVGVPERWLAHVARAASLPRQDTFYVGCLIKDLGPLFTAGHIDQVVAGDVGADMARVLLNHPSLTASHLERLLSLQKSFQIREQAAMLLKERPELSTAGVRSLLARSSSARITGTLISAETDALAHDRLYHSLLSSPEGRTRLREALRNPSSYSLLDRVLPSMVRPLIELKPEGADPADQSPVGHLFGMFRFLAALKRISALAPSASPLVPASRALFDANFPVFLVALKDSVWESPCSLKPLPADYHFGALAHLLRADPDLCDAFSMDTLFEMAASNEEDVRLAAISVLPAASAAHEAARVVAPPKARRNRR